METYNKILERKSQIDKRRNGQFSLSSVWEDQAVNGFVLSPEKIKETERQRQRDKKTKESE
jgi:hypothetical protein